MCKLCTWRCRSARSARQRVRDLRAGIVARIKPADVVMFELEMWCGRVRAALVSRPFALIRLAPKDALSLAPATSACTRTRGRFARRPQRGCSAAGGRGCRSARIGLVSNRNCCPNQRRRRRCDCRSYKMWCQTDRVWSAQSNDQRDGKDELGRRPAGARDGDGAQAARSWWCARRGRAQEVAGAQ